MIFADDHIVKCTAVKSLFKKLIILAILLIPLNTLAEEYVPGRLEYNVKKDGSLKITNLQPETTLKTKKEAYKKITKTFPPEIKKLTEGQRQNHHQEVEL